jgi:hypothetical protein
MGFNFMAALGGAASQITKDIEEQEQEVKLRTRTILDRHVAETAANRKEYKANKKKVQEQLNSIVSYFGDDPDRWNKARAIVAGGDAHVAKMSQYFAKAQDNKQDVNEIYKLTKSENDVGLTGVQDATNSLVQMAQITQPSFGASGQTSSLLGSTDMSKVYQRGRQEFEKAGLLDAVPTTATDKGATYGTGKLDLSKINTDAKSLDQMEANAFDIQQNSEKGSPEHTKATKTLEALANRKVQTSAAYNIAKLKAESDAKGDVPSLSGYTTIHTKGLDRINQRFKQAVVIGPDGKPIQSLENKDKYLQQVIKDYNKNFIKGLIRNGYDKNAQDLINSTPELAELENEVMKELEDQITGGESSKKEKAQKIVSDNKNISLDVVTQLKGINPNMTKEQLYKFMLQAYPKVPGVSVEDHAANINKLVEEAYK